MEAEGETSSSHRSAMATENYSFAAVGEEDVGQHHCYVFRVIPKRKDKYLIEGRIWIGDREFAIVKIAGRPAKEPSLWVNQTYFVRRYEKFDGFWLPYRDETSADVKVYGRQIFTVNYQQYAVNSTVSAQTGSRESGAPD